MAIDLKSLREKSSGMFQAEQLPLPVDAPTSTPAPARCSHKSKSRKLNLYPGECRFCKGTVERQAGYLGPKVDGRYTVEHLPGECVEPEPEPEQAKPEPGTRSVDDFTHALWPGIYTVLHFDEEATVFHSTYKAVLQADDASFAPGCIVIGHLIGRDNEGDYKNVALVDGSKLVPFKAIRGNNQMVADLKLLLDPSGWTVVIDDEEVEVVKPAKACLRCGALLSNPASIDVGMGPECIKKGW